MNLSLPEATNAKVYYYDLPIDLSYPLQTLCNYIGKKMGLVI